MKKHNGNSIVLFVLIASLLMPIYSFGQQQNYKTYSHTKFSIKHPDSFQIITNPQGLTGVVMIAPANRDGFTNNINVIVSNNSESIDDHSLLSVKDMRRVFPDFKLESSGFVKINDYQSYRIIVNYSMNGYPVKGIQYCTKKGNSSMYLITFTIAAKDYDRLKNSLDTIINSLVLL